MATVTGLTAERMLEIEAASIVDGNVVGDDLILTKHDDTTINAGSVRGPIGDTSDPSSIPSNTQTDSYTLVLGDAGKVVEGNKATAINITIPPNSSVAFPVHTVLEVFQLGAGQITIVAGSGVTLRSDGSKVKTAGQYATIGLRQRAANEWVLSGDLG